MANDQTTVEITLNTPHLKSDLDQAHKMVAEAGQDEASTHQDEASTHREYADERSDESNVRHARRITPNATTIKRTAS